VFKKSKWHICYCVALVRVLSTSRTALHNNPVKSQLVFGASGSKAELALLESPVEGIEDRAQLTLTVNPSMKRNADTHRAL